MKYLYILALAFTLSACVQSNEVRYDSPNTGNQTSGPKAWKNEDLPLLIYVPVEMNAYKVSIQKSAQNWEAALGRPVFNFVFDDVSKPNTQYSGDPYASLFDGYSGLFKNMSWNFPGTAARNYADKVDNSVLAFTGTLTTNGRITAADVLFNFGGNFRFVDVDTVSPADNTLPQQMDFESVLTHELGHFLGLAHVGPSYEVKDTCTGYDDDLVTPANYSIMCDSIVSKKKRRVISSKDIARIRALYPVP